MTTLQQGAISRSINNSETVQFVPLFHWYSLVGHRSVCVRRLCPLCLWHEQRRCSCGMPLMALYNNTSVICLCLTHHSL